MAFEEIKPDCISSNITDPDSMSIGIIKEELYY
jgi:hypothetical protein